MSGPGPTGGSSPPSLTHAHSPPVQATQPIQPQIAPPPSTTPTPQTGDANYRPLNVKDALTYLDQVKNQFHSSPDIYNRFLDIMKDFKAQTYVF
jgi:paired amphipathic helix protein Sin3a